MGLYLIVYLLDWIQIYFYNWGTKRTKELKENGGQGQRQTETDLDWVMCNVRVARSNNELYPPIDVKITFLWIWSLTDTKLSVRLGDETLPDTDPRTCTRLGSSGGVNVGAGWCSSVKYGGSLSHSSEKSDSVCMHFFVLFIWSSFLCEAHNCFWIYNKFFCFGSVFFFFFFFFKGDCVWFL